MSICMQVFVWIPVFSLWGLQFFLPRSETADLGADLLLTMFNFLKDSQTLWHQQHCFTFPLGGCQFSHILANTCYFVFFFLLILVMSLVWNGFSPHFDLMLFHLHFTNDEYLFIVLVWPFVEKYLSPLLICKPLSFCYLVVRIPFLDTGISLAFQVCFMSFCTYERPSLVPIFALKKLICIWV